MKNMKVAKKLIVGFLIVIVLAAAVGAAGIIGLSSMSNAAEHMYTDMGVPLGDLGLATEYFQRIRVQMRNAIIYTGDAGHLATVEADLTDRMAQFEADMDKYEPTLATEEGRRLFTETMSEFEGVVKPGIAAMMENAYQGMPALQLLDSIAPITAAADTIATDLRELTQVRLQSMSDANDGTTDLFVSLLVVIVAAIVVAIGASLFLALYISRLIAKPLIPLTSFMQRAGATGDISLDEEDARVIASYGKNKDEIGQTIAAAASFVTRVNVVSGALQTIAGGDLTAELEPLSDRDTLGVSLKKMSESLNGMFGEVNASSSQVSVGASQVADGAQALAQGATEQAATIEELSSSIAEIAQHTKENAAKAEEAAVLAETIKGNAEKGSGQMDEMIDAVRAISQSSQDISKVIKVINDIAFQTNILALNAAVEAARAGQHGKGFAVVADEVRNLAAKSAEAASDTESMIANSIEKADLGVRIADETSASLSQIVDGINTSSQLVGEIAALSEGQATAVGQINTGIDQVAQVIQQNSATAEESAAAAQEMSGQSDVLRELIAQFKIKGVEIPARLALSAADRRQLPAAQDVIF